MPRNLDRLKLLLVAWAIGSFILIAPFTTKGYFSSDSSSQSIRSLRNWDCLKGKDIVRDSRGRPVWLTSSELMKRVIEKEPLEIPSLLGKNNLKGEVTIQLLLGKDGRVECGRAVKGNPLAISSAMKSVPKWIFKPYDVKGEPRFVLGILTIPYDFSR